MGIDVYMYWSGRSLDAFSGWINQKRDDGKLPSPPDDLYCGANGYLRESYFSAAYATPYLMPEAFITDFDESLKNFRNWNSDMAAAQPLFCEEHITDRTIRILDKEYEEDFWAAKIPAKLLRARLPKAIEKAKERAEGDEEYAKAHIKEITDFVELAERIEEELGESVWIHASW